MEELDSLQSLFGTEEDQQSVDLAPLLIIDDSPDVINAFTSVLDEHFALIACLSYKEAKDQLNIQVRKGRLPVVLLDIKMAYKNGIEVFHLLKENHPELKIIFHSAYPGTDAHAKEVENLPHAGYLIKGEYSNLELLNTIQAALG